MSCQSNTYSKKQMMKPPIAHEAVDVQVPILCTGTSYIRNTRCPGDSILEKLGSSKIERVG
jgi:uncharacterized protein (DUF433 family)